MAAWLLLAWTGPAGAQAPAAASEASLKAAFLFQFGNYVDWPDGRLDDGGAPLVIAVLGSEAVARSLEVIARGRSVLGRPVQVLRADDAAAAVGAHIVYVGGELEDRERAGRALRGRPLLLVSSTNDGDLPGSMVQFVLVNGRLRFDVALDAASAAGLRISSRLLGVARRVTGQA